MNLKARISEDMKSAMRAGDKERLAAIRLILSACKQIEVDERRELSDADVTAILNRMLKQRRESIEQFNTAGRSDLSAKEQAEVNVIKAYLPEQLGAAEVEAAITAAISATGASGPKDMGKLMAALKSSLAGRADMTAVSALVRARLGG
jgi:hypothetical protein